MIVFGEIQGIFAILASFSKWRDIDRFYFIPLPLDMSYRVAGMVTHIAPPPYYLGTLLRCSLEHPELFSAECGCWNISGNDSRPSALRGAAHHRLPARENYFPRSRRTLRFMR